SDASAARPSRAASGGAAAKLAYSAQVGPLGCSAVVTAEDATRARPGPGGSPVSAPPFGGAQGRVLVAAVGGVGGHARRHDLVDAVEQGRVEHDLGGRQ